MPTYEYECKACHHQLEAFQKMSDAPLTDCPKCHAQTLSKQISAAGFQLKGTGWYATDYKKPAKSSAGNDKSAAGESASTKNSAESTSGSAKPDKDNKGAAS